MKRLDFVLIMVYITISIIIGYVLLWGPSDAPDLVEVKVDNVLFARYSLPLDQPLEVKLDDSGHNILVIDGYEVYIKEANCPDQLCVHQGVIKKSGAMLVCLPNKITVEIIGERNDGVDVISY